MKTSIVSLLLFICFAIGCKSAECIEKSSENCVCTFQYDPVCGCNGKTYANSCEAECNGITDYKKGACE